MVHINNQSVNNEPHIAFGGEKCLVLVDSTENTHYH